MRTWAAPSAKEGAAQAFTSVVPRVPPSAVPPNFSDVAAQRSAHGSVHCTEAVPSPMSTDAFSSSTTVAVTVSVNPVEPTGTSPSN